MSYVVSRFLRVIQGTATYNINFVDYTLHERDFLFTPPGTVIEMTKMSDDYAVEVLVVSNLPGIHRQDIEKLKLFEVIYLSLTDEEWQRNTTYFFLIAQQLQRSNPVLESISHLVVSMITDIQNTWQALATKQALHYVSRGEEVFTKFLNLIRQYGATERSIPFYANQLALTPNHLSAVIRQQSGLSVMDWLNRITVMEAKILLKHTSLLMYEIAERLHFPEATAFNRYFKKQTGITPLEYRNK